MLNYLNNDLKKYHKTYKILKIKKYCYFEKKTKKLEKDIESHFVTLIERGVCKKNTFQRHVTTCSNMFTRIYSVAQQYIQYC